MKLPFFFIFLFFLIPLTMAEINIGEENTLVRGVNIVAPPTTITVSSIVDTNATTACSGSQVLLGNGSCGLVGAGGGDFSSTDFQSAFNVNISNGFINYSTIGNMTADVYFGDGQQLNLATLNNPIFKTIQDIQTLFHSSGVFNANVTVNFIVLNSDNTFNVTAGSGTIRSTDNATDTLFFFDWSASNNIAIADNTALFVGIERNGGSPRVITKSTNTWDFQTEFPLGSLTRDVTGVHLQREDHAVGDHANNMIQRLFATLPFSRDNRAGGLILGTKELNITVSAGTIWEKLNQFPIKAIDTTGSDVFDRYYRDGSGGWLAQLDRSEFNNTHFDDGSGTLVALGNNKFSIEWVYLEVDNEIVTIFGQEEVNTEGAAEALSPPSTVPDRVALHSRLIGRIIFQKDAMDASSVESVFTTTFTTAGVTDHGNLAGLGDDDHPQYLLTDGGRALTGNWNAIKNITADTFFGIGSFLTGIITGNIFNQDLNSTNNVQFSNLTIIDLGNLTITGDLNVDGFQTLGFVSSGGLFAGDLNMSGLLYVGEDVLINNNLLVNNFQVLGTANTGGLSVGDINISGFYYGDGSKLQSLPLGNPFDQELNISSNVTFQNLTINGNLSIDGGIIYGNIIGTQLRNGTSNIPIATSTTVIIDFTIEEYDFGNLHSTTINPERVTIPIEGFWDATCSVSWQASFLGKRRIVWIANDTVAFAMQENSPTNTQQRQTISTTKYMLVGDFFVCRVFQDSGVSLVIQPVNDYSVRFTVTLKAAAP